MKRRTVLIVAILSVVIGMFGGEAFASAACTAVGGVQNVAPSECVISSAITTPCPFTLTLPAGEDLRMTSGGSISCNDTGAPPNSAQNITIVVDADMIMEAGSAIRAENNNNGGSGGNISLTVSGDFTMRGPSGQTPGAVISSKKASGCDGCSADGGAAGDITIKVGNVTFPDGVATCAATPAGDILVEGGAVIIANSPGQAGTIKMFAGKDITINGSVLSQGVGTTRGEGGPITIDACCDLIIGDTGVVSSRGQDPGADLVHLEACCVFIFGLVESTGPGHDTFDNLCNVNRPGKPANSTGCIEVWAGDEITIDATGTHKGQLNADVGLTGGPQGSSWIDVLAHKQISIFGNATPPPAGTNNNTNPPYAIHANMPTQNGHGGDITVISTHSGVVTTGRAIQANSSTLSNGGKGGHIQVLAHDAVAFGTAFIQAAGDTTGGGSQQGGTILGHSFNVPFKVTGAAPGQLNATGPGGTVTLHGCGQVAADYTGTIIGALNIDPSCTGGNPPLPVPANTLLPAIDCELTFCQTQQVGSKRGIKFNDVNGDGVQGIGESGLPGWTMHIFGTTSGGAPVHETVVTGADGSYVAPTLSPGTYTICEELQGGWVQTFPKANTIPPVGETIADCSTHTDGGTITPGPFGYTFTITEAGEQLVGNNFGNKLDVSCPKFPTLPVNFVVFIDPGNPTQIQDVINDPATTNKTVLIMPHLGDKIENIVINKKMNLYGCSITLTATDPDEPVVRITSGANGGLTKDVHSTGSNVAGYKIEGSQHIVQNTRSYNNGFNDAAGFLITGNSNLVTGALGTVNNGVGFKVTGSSNVIDSNNGIENNVGDGVLIAGGTGNTVKKVTVRGNGGNGIKVDAGAMGTTVAENKAFSNTLNGILVLGSNTTVSKNVAGDVNLDNSGDGIRVVGNNGPISENTARSNDLVGIRVTGTGHKLTKNKSGGNAAQNNVSCQYVVGPNNSNGNGNLSSNAAFNFTGAGANAPNGCVPLPPLP